jgi:hypothetical protein
MELLPDRIEPVQCHNETGWDSFGAQKRDGLFCSFGGRTRLFHCAVPASIIQLPWSIDRYAYTHLVFLEEGDVVYVNQASVGLQ